jgi:phosphoribosyl 1,2-cyclic phosphodiesterase
VRFQVLASGSAGNAILVRAGEITLLVDAGLPLDELERRLESARVAPHTLDAIALTHGHLDHARSAGRLSRKTGACVLAVNGLLSNASLRGARQTRAISPGRPIEVLARRGRDVLHLTGVPLPHDADPTLAFRLEHEGRVAVVCTDLGTPQRDLAGPLGEADLLYLEFNHDERLLAQGPYTPALKRRVAGPRGHLSNEQAATLLEALAGTRLRTLVLAHLSATNNTPELALQAARAALARCGRTDVELFVAAQDHVGPALAVGRHRTPGFP